MTMTSYPAIARFAVAGLVGIAACGTLGDNLPTTASSIKAPTSARAALGVTLDPTPELGKLKLCKAGNASGEFSITREQFGTPPATGYSFDFEQANFTINAGVCLVAGEDDGGNLVSSLLRITEVSDGLASISALRIDQEPDALPTTISAFTFVNGDQVTVNRYHGVTITFVNHVEENGCTYTQGWYKNEKHVWPSGSITRGSSFDGGASYASILDTPPRGNVYYVLAHQYITALLNIQGGASSTDIADELDDAADYFAAASPNNPLPAGWTKDEVTALAEALDDYNNGLTGPGHCDDEVLEVVD
jgi:hypothetical protein